MEEAAEWQQQPEELSLGLLTRPLRARFLDVARTCNLTMLVSCWFFFTVTTTRDGTPSVQIEGAGYEALDDDEEEGMVAASRSKALRLALIRAVAETSTETSTVEAPATIRGPFCFSRTFPTGRWELTDVLQPH